MCVFSASLSSQSSRDPSPATRTNSVLSGQGGNLSHKLYQDNHHNIRTSNVYSPSHNHFNSSQSDQLKSNTGNIINHVTQPALMNTIKSNTVEQKQFNFVLQSQQHFQKQNVSTAASPLTVSSSSNHIIKSVGGNIVSPYPERSQANTSVTNSILNQSHLSTPYSVAQTSQKYGSENYISPPTNVRGIPNAGVKLDGSSGDMSRQIPLQSQSLLTRPVHTSTEARNFTSNQVRCVY